METPAGRPKTSLRPVVLLTGLFFANVLARTIFSPLLLWIERDLNIYHAQAGILLLFVAVGYSVSILLSGFVSAATSHRRAILLSNGLLSLGLLSVAVSRSLWGVRLSLLSLGLSAGLYLASGLTIIFHQVDQRLWGRALSLHELAPNAGFVIAPLLAQGLLAALGWRGIVLVLGGINLLSGLLFLVLGRRDGLRGEPPVFSNVREIFGNRSFWIMVVFFVLAASAEFGVYSMLPTYLMSERRMSLQTSSALVAGSRVIGIVVMFSAGWLSDRIGIARTIVLVLAGGGILTVLLGVSSNAVLPWVVLLQAAPIVAFFPVGLSALGRIGSGKTKSLNISFMVPIAYVVGAGLAPAGMGALGEAGRFKAAFVVLGALVIVSTLLAKLLRIDGKS